MNPVRSFIGSISEFFVKRLFDIQEIEEMKLNSSTLTFPNDIEVVFFNNYINKSLKPIQFILLIACIFYTFFGLLDLVLTDNFKMLLILWFIRLIVVLIILGVRYLSCHLLFKKYVPIMLTTVVMSAGMGIIIMIIISDNPEITYSYYAGIVLIFIFGYGGIGVGSYYIALSGFIIVVIYEIVAIVKLSSNQMNYSVFISNNFFFISANIIGMIIAYLMEYNIRRDFFLVQLVEDKRRELERAYEELKKLDDRKSEFLSTVSHELRTPLTSVKGCIENLLCGAYGQINDQQRERIEIALTCVNDEARLVENLLDLVRIQENSISVNYYPENLTLIIHRVVNIFEYDAKEKGITLELNIQVDNNLYILLDRVKIKQVLTNLIHNALKFTPSGGNITISASREKDFIICSVTDTGIGIPKSKINKVFDRFYQVNSSLTRTAGGAGIGLNIAHKYVELHNGKIWVESTLNIGSTFAFTVPMIL